MDQNAPGRLMFVIWLMFGLLLTGLAIAKGEVIALALPFLAYLAVAALHAPRALEMSASRTLKIVDKEQQAAQEAEGKPVNPDESANDLASAALHTGIHSREIQVAVELRWQSEGHRVDEVEIKDGAPAELGLRSGAWHRLTRLPHGNELNLEYALQPERGWHQFQEVQVTLREHFNLFSRQIALDERDEIHTLPVFPRLRRLAVRPESTRGFAGPIASRQSGSGMVFWGVREYQLGDSLQRINWRLSARHDRRLYGSQALISNEFEQERIADIGIILDARDSVNLRSGNYLLFERSVSAAAALAEAFLEDGHRVSLLTYGYGMQRVYPGLGKVHKARILQTLAKVEPGSNDALENFRHLPTRLFASRSQIVLISPLTAMDYPALVSLRAKGYSILLIAPDPLDLEAQQASAPSSNWEVSAEDHHKRDSLALRLAKLERRLLLSRLSGIGVTVIEWPMHKTLEQVMAAEANRLAHHRLSGILHANRMGSL